MTDSFTDCGRRRTSCIYLAQPQLRNSRRWSEQEERARNIAYSPARFQRQIQTTRAFSWLLGCLCEIQRKRFGQRYWASGFAFRGQRSNREIEGQGFREWTQTAEDWYRRQRIVRTGSATAAFGRSARSADSARGGSLPAQLFDRVLLLLSCVTLFYRTNISNFPYRCTTPNVSSIWATQPAVFSSRTPPPFIIITFFFLVPCSYFPLRRFPPFFPLITYTLPLVSSGLFLSLSIAFPLSGLWYHSIRKQRVNSVAYEIIKEGRTQVRLIV